MRTLLVLLVSGALAACAQASDDAAGSGAEAESEAAAAPERPTIADAEVDRIWNRMMDQIAPDGGFQKTRYLAFDWVVNRPEGEEDLVRSHEWALWEGDYRVEAPTDDGRMVALFNVNSPEEGRVWIDGELQEGEEATELLNRAYRMFINDSYWLLMPFKWADDGVTASYVGEMEMRGDTMEVVELTFDSVGVTPQNKYRAYVDPETGMMKLWAHYREASQDEPNFILEWADWQDFGPIMLSSERLNEEGVSPIYFQNLAADTVVPQGAFEPPM